MSGVIGAMKTTMYTDVPRFTRCCFCFPLRYSLLVWGCIMLVWNSLTLIFAISIVHGKFSSATDSYLMYFLLICGSVGYSLNILASIILIIAALKKHEKLFRVCYFSGIATLICMFLYTIYGIVEYINFCNYVMEASTTFMVREIVKITILNTADLFLEVYVILLIRAEMMKLREHSKIQFTNNATDGQIFVETIQQDDIY